jgi:hypothetical protein
MAFSKELSEEGKKLHYDSIVIDGCSFFLEGHNQTLKTAGVTALNLTIPFPADSKGEALKKIADCYHVINKDPNLRLVLTVDNRFAKFQAV